MKVENLNSNVTVQMVKTKKSFDAILRQAQSLSPMDRETSSNRSRNNATDYTCAAYLNGYPDTLNGEFND